MIVTQRANWLCFCLLVWLICMGFAQTIMITPYLCYCAQIHSLSDQEAQHPLSAFPLLKVVTLISLIVCPVFKRNESACMQRFYALVFPLPSLWVSHTVSASPGHAQLFTQPLVCYCSQFNVPHRILSVCLQPNCSLLKEDQQALLHVKCADL